MELGLCRPWSSPFFYRCRRRQGTLPRFSRRETRPGWESAARIGPAAHRRLDQAPAPGPSINEVTRVLPLEKAIFFRFCGLTPAALLLQVSKSFAPIV